MDLMDRMDLIFTLSMKSMKSIKSMKSMKSMKSISAAMEQHCLHRTLWSKTPLFIAFALPPAVKFRSLVPP